MKLGSTPDIIGACNQTTRCIHFDDHFEGAWPRSDLQYWTNERILRVFNVPDFTEEMRRRRVAASCWFESPHESAAMWRLYAPGEEGVAIATTFGKLDNLIKTAAKPTWLVGAARVTYIDHSNDGWIEKLGEDERRLNVLMPFMLKNISYEHEKEVRALVIAAMEKIGSDGLDLQVSLNDFIDEIVDNPFCQTWFTEAVAGVADRYGLESKRRRSSLSPDVFYMDRKQGREQLGAPLKVDTASAPDTPVARGDDEFPRACTSPSGKARAGAADLTSEAGDRALCLSQQLRTDLRARNDRR